MSWKAHDNIVKGLFELAGYKPCANGKVTHAARVWAARWAQQCSLNLKVCVGVGPWASVALMQLYICALPKGSTVRSFVLGVQGVEGRDLM